MVRERGTERETERERERHKERDIKERRYLCDGHLGRALAPQAQQDGENRK